MALDQIHPAGELFAEVNRLAQDAVEAAAADIGGGSGKRKAVPLESHGALQREPLALPALRHGIAQMTGFGGGLLSQSKYRSRVWPALDTAYATSFCSSLRQQGPALKKNLLLEGTLTAYLRLSSWSDAQDEELKVLRASAPAAIRVPGRPIPPEESGNNPRCSNLHRLLVLWTSTIPITICEPLAESS
jgi:hypothetical protein